MTPSELLSRAADLVRDTAAETVPGPWRQHDTHLGVGGHTATVMRGEWNDVELVAWLPTWNHEPWDNSRKSFTTARWIALASPAVAGYIEAFLRAAAVEEANSSPLEYGSATIGGFMAVARALAEQITGERAGFPPGGDT